MSKLKYKRWVVVDAEKIMNAHVAPDRAHEEAKKPAAENIGRQYVVMESTVVFEAEAHVGDTELYRDWDAAKALRATSNRMDEPDFAEVEAEPQPPITAQSKDDAALDKIAF